MILVTGAGGTVGRELVQQLSRRKVRFRAGYRSEPKLARALETGIDAVSLDFARPASLPPALDGVETLFLLAGGSVDQTQLELNAVKAAAGARVRRIVKLSVWDAQSESFTFARLHRPVEKAIESSGMSWTFLRPNGFMQNLANFFAATIRAQGAFHLCGGGARISHIDVRDIAAVAATVLETAGHDGRAYDLSGPEPLTYDEIARKLTATLGRAVSYVDITPADLIQGMLNSGAPRWYADAVVDLMHYYVAGRAARVTPAVREITGRDPISFDAFVRDHIDSFREPPAS